MNKALLISIAGLGIGIGAFMWTRSSSAKAQNVIASGGGDKDPSAQYCPPGYDCSATGEFATSPDFTDSPTTWLKNKWREWGVTPYLEN